MKRKRQRHLYFTKDWFVFPFAIGWESQLLMYINPTSRLTFHFLWWHSVWDFERKVNYDNQ